MFHSRLAEFQEIMLTRQDRAEAEYATRVALKPCNRWFSTARSFEFQIWFIRVNREMPEVKKSSSGLSLSVKKSEYWIAESVRDERFEELYEIESELSK